MLLEGTNDFEEFTESDRSNLRIVEKSIPAAMNTTPEGREVLKSWEKTAKLDLLNASLNRSIMTIRDLLALVESQM
jgi:hypothetical protein